MSIICFGELIVDFMSMEAGRPLWQVERFQKNVGGAPANVAIGLHHHSIVVDLWSKVGMDSFGKFLIEQLNHIGISTQNIVEDSHHPTKLAFVNVDNFGERHFEFHNLNSAERYMRLEDFDLAQLKEARIFHFGGVALLGETTANTLMQILKMVKKNGTLISFDPNFRIDLLPDPNVILARLDEVLAYINILKLSQEDRAQLFPDSSPSDILRKGISLLIFTEGAGGARFFTKREEVTVPAEKIKVVDTTGAGDAFSAAFLSRLFYDPVDSLKDISPDQLREWGRFSNHWAGRIIQYPGAVNAYFE